MAEGETVVETGTEEVTVTTQSSDVAQKEPHKEFEIVEWFKNKIKESRNYLKEFSALFEEFKEKDVAIFAVCAEPQDQADKMEQELSLPFKCYSDITHKLAKYLAEEKLITIKISGGENSTDSYFYKVHPAIKHYKYGVAQPGVLAINSVGKGLYNWAINPSFMNIGGATDRPVPVDIWKIVKAKMDNPDDDQNVTVQRRGMFSVFRKH